MSDEQYFEEARTVIEMIKDIMAILQETDDITTILSVLEVVNSNVMSGFESNDDKTKIWKAMFDKVSAHMMGETDLYVSEYN